MTELEKYFAPFKKNTIGNDAEFEGPYGIKKIVYADWIASGRLYAPIEDKIRNEFGPFVANTHTETTETGLKMTNAYHKAHEIIKQHVNAGKDDVILTTGFGMTGAISKFLRILGLSIPEQLIPYCNIPDNEKPVVFVTHMEHHSNQLPWLESIAELHLLPYNKAKLVDLEASYEYIKKYNKGRKVIGAFSACSNVTGIETPYHRLAEIIHEFGGKCFVDFAASAPYINIDMHPKGSHQYLDAIYFSPHKFLGGPGASGVLIFDSKLYKRQVPDHPGGGTVNWTNPWGGRSYYKDIERREDGGTPGFLQAIRTALAVKLKEKMGVEKIKQREEELLEIAFRELKNIKGIHLLADNVTERLGVISFYFDNVHFNLVIKILNDRFGIQIRGGCVCAGTYGHVLLDVDEEHSRRITDKIDQGDLSEKPGWARLSIHPTMTDEELKYIINAINQIINNIDQWGEEYIYSPSTNEFYHKTFTSKNDIIKKWFSV